jgi:anti-anti-sigma factor
MEGPPPKFRVQVITSDGEQPVIVMEGDLDLASLEEAESAIQTARDSGDGPLVVDLRGLEFFGSVGLHLLLDLADDYDQLSRRLTVLPSQSVLRFVELVGVSERFDMRPGP